MPLYEYLCGSCGHRFERIQKFSDPPVRECPSCGAATVEKQISSPAIQFKGAGWYVTDYARSGQSEKSAGAEKASSSGGDSTAKTDAAKTETKSDAAPASSSTPSADKK